MDLIKLGHACVRLRHGDTTIVIDPGTFSGADVPVGADAVLVTHEHFDTSTVTGCAQGERGAVAAACAATFVGRGQSVNGSPTADDPDPDVQLVLASYAAFARGDIDQAVAPLHPQVEWIEPEEFPYGGRHQGPQAVVEYLRNSRALWAEFVSEPAAHRVGDDIVIVHHVYGRLADGSPHDVTVADVFTLRDGLVVRMQAYADPAEAFAAGS